jgi:putative transposase
MKNDRVDGVVNGGSCPSGSSGQLQTVVTCRGDRNAIEGKLSLPSLAELALLEPGQYLSIRYSERLAENDIVASVGSTGDSCDCDDEAFNSLYKWELIYPKGPWTGLDDVEFVTMGYIDWFNHRRLHGEITDDNSYVTPAEFEAAYYRQNSTRLRGGYPIAGAVMEPGAIQRVAQGVSGPPTPSDVEDVGAEWRRGAHPAPVARS